MTVILFSEHNFTYYLYTDKEQTKLIIAKEAET